MEKNDAACKKHHKHWVISLRSILLDNQNPLKKGKKYYFLESSEANDSRDGSIWSNPNMIELVMPFIEVIPSKYAF